ncbi:nucleolar protein,Nop52-domain-containing protein [Biscogniauxia sp. FL1348]|nr:nucleolar protein,Nop52-domain-containing protein [Biscogniauxia sp. FL1348]
MAANDDTASMPFIKNLASSDRKIRDSALSTLRAFLSGSRRQLSTTDNLKLWKGLFYSLWMCDRALPQQQLCADLAGLTRALPDEAAVAPWLAAFWATVAREWTTGIDVLRMEKFLLLVRRVFAASLEWVLLQPGGGSSSSRGHSGGREPGGKKNKNNNYNDNNKSGERNGNKKRDAATGSRNGNEEAFDRAGAMLDVFADWPLERTGDLAKVPVGLRLHVLDIWVDEAEKLGLLETDDDDASEDDDEQDGEEEKEKKREFLGRIRELVEVQTKSACKPVRARAKESLADERLPWNRSDEEDGGDGDVEMTTTTTTVGGGGAPGDSWDGFED